MENKAVKKVGTLTFHIAHNYGAVLQAYALPKAVESLGYHCEIIHYCFPYIYPWGHVECFSELLKIYGLVGGTLRFIKRLLLGVYNPASQKNKFEHFIYHTLPLSKIAYHFAAELNNLDYDAILFGSDQIWNSGLTNGIAKEFVGGFICPEKTKKIAYAASCGRNCFNQEEKGCYYPLLGSFSALSVREQGLCRSLREDGFPAKLVLDPTLLLTKYQWQELIQAKKYQRIRPQKEYLLVYAFDEDPSIYRLVDTVKELYDLEVCCIAYQTKEEIKKYHVYTDCGPEEFVALVAGASRVVTTSFHGTAFSILFEKPFYCIPHPTLHERTDSLLALLDIEDRNCNADTNIVAMKEIDWVSVSEKIDRHRKEALAFLKEALG